MVHKIIISVFLLLGWMATPILHAQPGTGGISSIKRALDSNDIQGAAALLQAQLQTALATGNTDTLPAYVFYAGKVAYKQKGVGKGTQAVLQLIRQIEQTHPGDEVLRRTWEQAAAFYEYIGRNQPAYEATEKSYIYASRVPGFSDNQLADIESDLGVYAQRMGNISLSTRHHRKALELFTHAANPDYEGLFRSYNSMGGCMWYASKTDSSLFYFKKALATLALLDSTPHNLYYRPAIVQNNLAALYSLQGNTTEAIHAMEFTIKSLRQFQGSQNPGPKKDAALEFEFQAIDNLGGIYKELGDYAKTKELLEYAYQQKRQHFDANSPELFKSQVMLGQLYFAMRDQTKALDYLQRGLALIRQQEGSYLYWEADACKGLALVYDELGQKETAAGYFEEADHLYAQSFQGAYDYVYLDFLVNAALFYAENGEPEKAVAVANRSYHYVTTTQGAQTLLAFYQLLNLSEIHFIAGHYKEALRYSGQSLDVVNTLIRNSDLLLDSVKMELKKPKAILLKTKASYKLLAQKDSAHLLPLQQELNEALDLIERRKSILTDAEDIGLLMADQHELLEFAKTLSLELYDATQNSRYLDELIGLHESGMYNRIRSRLDQQQSLRFAHIPAATAAKEKQLKLAIATALQGDAAHDVKIQAYLDAIETWNRYKSGLRQQYPRYYNMRYASIFRPLGELRRHIPPQSTVIRYFFVGDQLLALVADQAQQHLYKLDTTGLPANIRLLSAEWSNAAATGRALHTLYRQLWQPLEKSIHHTRVIIVPDGMLYNISFEALTPAAIDRFENLEQNCLLSRYLISYRYSLFLLEQNQAPPAMQGDFVAFAPGFFDDMKKSYLAHTTDSLDQDNNYLSLLPLPFTTRLAQQTQNLLGGQLYLNEGSTEGRFKDDAGHHRIIHIGTHAESNNMHPEYSRLIFAHNNMAPQEDNSLFLFEIYNCDLSSELTVLTACESGKPGYQDGEGMISLAHAFHYAGSESILTSLWKVDDQSSAAILQAFYENLVKGLPKDEALRQAKLHYLQQADGRTLAPPYWAGLVIMGNTAPVVLEKKPYGLFWVLGGILLLGLGAFWYSRRQPKSSTA